MKHTLSIISCLLLIGCFVSTGFAETKPTDMPKVRLETSLGNITIELNAPAAPKTVENFLAYVNDGFYNGTIFHRVIKGFMIQGGGFTENMQQKPAKPAIINEADNGLLNLRGTIAMARTNAPHSASSQFFINTVNNTSLNFTAKTGPGWGYCVFGKVVEGMDVVDAIEKQPTTVKNSFQDVPVTPVIIKNAVVIIAPETKTAIKSKENKNPDKTQE
jgi:peptidyl-prolyl cis-trans isomerase B (cyclophilin B)